MNLHIIDIIIILFLSYFTYAGFKNGFIKELSNLISYITAFLLSNKIAQIIYPYLDIFIPDKALQYKISYVISFVVIVYLFKLFSHIIEKFINMQWQNKALGLILGAINGILIFSLIISIFKEVVPQHISIHKDWREKYYLYKTLDDLQQEYLIQYIDIESKDGENF